MMDVSSVAASSSAMYQSQLEAKVGTAVLKKAIDLQGDAALRLMASLPDVAAMSPSHLGQHIDVYV